MEVKEFFFISFNINFMFLKFLERFLKVELVDYIVIDLKVFFVEFYGFLGEVLKCFWEFFFMGFELILDYGIFLELRIFVVRGFD